LGIMMSGPLIMMVRQVLLIRALVLEILITRYLLHLHIEVVFELLITYSFPSSSSFSPIDLVANLEFFLGGPDHNYPRVWW